MWNVTVFSHRRPPPAGSTASTFSSPGIHHPSCPLLLASPAGTRPVINVSVAGGPTVPVLFDTGSTGLRIFADKGGLRWPQDLGSQRLAPSVPGITWKEDLRRHPLSSLGYRPLDDRFHKITSASCTASKPNCPRPVVRPRPSATPVWWGFSVPVSDRAQRSVRCSRQGPPVSSLFGDDCWQRHDGDVESACWNRHRDVLYAAGNASDASNGAPGLDQQVNGCWGGG